MKLLAPAFWILTLSSLSCDGSRLQRIHVDPVSGEFVDELGRIRLFHGINSVIKGFPWYDFRILDPDRQKEIADLGVNVVRLGAMWTGVEPEEGNINATYLAILEKLVSDFADLGVYTILDMHQDVLWQAGPEENEGYWGIPPWAKHKLEPSKHLFPWPFVQPKAWECGYFTEEISGGFGQLYDNVNGVADSMAQFWKVLAERFNQQPAVLGYELINEPGHGNVYKDLSLLLPGVAGWKSFQPLYERTSKVIREVDDEAIIFWEPALYAYFLPVELDPVTEQTVVDVMSSYGMADILFLMEIVCGPLQADVVAANSPSLEDAVRGLGERLELAAEKPARESPTIFGPGFDQPPGGPDYRNRTAISWHYYCWGVYIGTDEPYDVVRKWFCDTLMGPSVFDTVKMRRKEVGAGSFLTEFGVCYPNISRPDTINTQECNFVLEQAERSFESWTYWDTASGFTFWDADGKLKDDLVIFFARPYPMATAGRPHKLSFDVYTKVFSYQFYPDPTLEGVPTEIFIPPMQYPDGKFQVSTSSNLEWMLSEDGANVLLVFNSLESSPDQIAFVTVSRKE